MQKSTTESEDESELNKSVDQNTWKERLIAATTTWVTRLGVSGLCGYCSGYFVKKTLIRSKLHYFIGKKGL